MHMPIPMVLVGLIHEKEFQFWVQLITNSKTKAPRVLNKAHLCLIVLVYFRRCTLVSLYFDQHELSRY